MGGFLYVDKPEGVTSHDVVAMVRRSARSRRVGHAGTLDPFATGLLVIAVGQCTRLLPYIGGEPKVYDAVIAFGAETETDDSTGEVTHERQVVELSVEVLAVAFDSLSGQIVQVPPSFSAKHVNGTRAYALARRGVHVELQPVSVHVRSWELLSLETDAIAVRITCGGGTYVRALARDLGRALGSAAHCSKLRRVASGAAHVDTAVSTSELLPGAIADGIVPLRDPVSLLDGCVIESLDASSAADISHGRSVAATAAGERAALMHDDSLIAIAIRGEDDRWNPRVVFPV